MRTATSAGKAALAIGAAAALLCAAGPAAPGRITKADAEILIYISPYAHEVRAAGEGLVMDAEDARQEPGFFTFYVVATASKPRGGGLDMPEYLAVNARTGSLWDARSVTRITSRELEDVLKVMRSAHGITEATMRRFDGLKP